jgi:hypothetical protein
MIDQKYIDRFYTKVDKTTTPNGCWIWTASKDDKGYGNYGCPENSKNKKYRAHRFSYLISKGPIPEDLVVRHKCDNPSCVRPEHLELGTQYDNIQDRVNRNRSNTAIGSKSGSSKLIDDQVKEIKTRVKLGYYGNVKELSLEFNISKSAIRKIALNKTWKHI